MLESLGMKEPALAALARAAYHLLGLQSFYTAGPKEIRAWTIPVGATAPQAAGVIHTDFEKGFIRAEIYSVADLEQYKSEKAIRDAGRLRIEGKAYVMRDGGRLPLPVQLVGGCGGRRGPTGRRPRDRDRSPRAALGRAVGWRDRPRATSARDRPEALLRCDRRAGPPFDARCCRVRSSPPSP